MRLVVCRDGKEVTLQLTRTPMARGDKLNLVSMEQMQDEQLVVVVQMEQMEGTREKARNDGPLSRQICKVLGKYKDVLTNELFQELPPKREVDHKIEVIPGSEPPSKAPYRLNQKELLELKKQLNDCGSMNKQERGRRC